MIWNSSNVEEAMTCQACAFYHAEKSQCRRYAPQPQATSANAVWPTTGSNDWCGDFKAKDAAKAA